ncbi:ribonuclease Oy [Drosophila grimshawi]|uniref:ribonuclease Oy n=1 Tax=Drosophila grimshawi TaxID=7222 RepID=UPI000C87123F|nr:ribonuclease Oy [Drosophila grimshawi]
MQKQQQYLLTFTILLCSIVVTKTSPFSALDISDSGIALGNVSDESSSSAEQPLKRPSAADFSDEDDDDDYSLYANDLGKDAQSFDVLIFTQQWPVTTCYHWREQDPSHECTLPQKKEFWTIHGIWPTKWGQIGPNFCNKSAEFDPDQLQAILDRLNTYWLDLEGDAPQDDLWKHEWLKHGTCAAVLTELDNELKYFGQGLKWRQKYVISDVLDAAGIHPDSDNTIIVLNNALVRGLGKNPSIHCLYDRKHSISYLSEIRICFNKSLELIDCDGVKLVDVVAIKYPGGTVNTNCHVGSPVHYPSLVPPVQRKEDWKLSLVNVYKLLQFLMWFTL